MLFSPGMQVEAPIERPGVRVLNTSTTNRCSYICPFNNPAASTEWTVEGQAYLLTTQPCIYSVRLGQVFKGNISVRIVIVIPHQQSLQWNLRVKDTMGSATLSFVERLSFSRRLKLYYKCCGKGGCPFLGG